MGEKHSHGPHGRRCWYCGEVRTRWSREHVVPLDMGGKLVVRHRICKDCNEMAGRNIDGPFGRTFLVQLQRAAYGIPRRSGRMAKASAIGEVEGGGRARIEWNARGGDLGMWGTDPGGRRRIRFQRMQLVDLRLWARFSGKVALAVASMAVDERWLDTERGRELRAFVHEDAFPSSLWPDGAPPPYVLPQDDPLAGRLRHDQHLLTVSPIEGQAVVALILFGSWCTAVPIGVNMKPGDEIAWLLDPHEPAPAAQSYWQLMEDLKVRTSDAGATAPPAS